jgi:hypothetical protein
MASTPDSRQILMKIRPVGADRHTDGPRDRHDVTNSRFFRSFAKVSKSCGLLGSSPKGGVKQNQLMIVLMVLQA